MLSSFFVIDTNITIMPGQFYPITDHANSIIEKKQLMTNVISGLNIYYYNSGKEPAILFSYRIIRTIISYNLEVTYGKHSSQNRKSGKAIR